MPKVLVTGGAGFIGSHVVDRLLESGSEVVVIDDFSSGKEENLEQHKNNPKLRVFRKNICDKDILKLFNGVEIVYHLAAIPRVQYSIEHPEITNKSNINGTLNVLEMCRKAGVKRVVYSASSSAYGDQDRMPLTEGMLPNPMSPYALQKLAGEHYCKLYYLLHGIETVSLRYFNVFGPRQDPSGGYACLIPKCIDLAKKGVGITINGDGKQTRDFTYVKDVIEANMLAGKVDNKKAFGNVFNIGSGKNRSVNEVVKGIIGDRDIRLKHGPAVVEPKDTLADISRSKEILGWKPRWKFEDAIKETVDWCNR